MNSSHSLDPLARLTCIMAVPQAIPTMCQMEYISYLWFPGRCHIFQGHRSDFNNDLRDDSNSAPVLGPRRLFKCNSNNGPSLGHSNLVSDKVYICSGLISWWLLYLAKCPMPDFNNGLGNDLNGSRSLAPRRLFETDVNNDPPQAIPRGRIHLFRSPTYSFLVGAISVQGPHV